MNKKSLPSIRVNENTISNMVRSIEKYNKENLVELTIQDFRRLSYEFLSQMILQDKELDVKLLRK